MLTFFTQQTLAASILMYTSLKQFKYQSVKPYRCKKKDFKSTYEYFIHSCNASSHQNYSQKL